MSAARVTIATTARKTYDGCLRVGSAARVAAPRGASRRGTPGAMGSSFTGAGAASCEGSSGALVASPAFGAFSSIGSGIVREAIYAIDSGAARELPHACAFAVIRAPCEGTAHLFKYRSCSRSPRRARRSGRLGRSSAASIPSCRSGSRATGFARASARTRRATRSAARSLPCPTRWRLASRRPSARAASSGSTRTRRRRSRSPRAMRAATSSRLRRRAASRSASTCPCSQALTEDPDARALYLFPTKALARDQEAALRELVTASGIRSSAIVFDGDTPGDARRAARERGGIVMTNPDMLHTGILPHHANWARTFQNLKFVVVDEMHTYRGVFGSHVANVLRRLLRVARVPRIAADAPRRHGHDRQPARARGAPLRRDGRGARAARRERRARGRAAHVPLQPAGRERRARDPRELREAGDDARGGSRARARADDRLRPVAEQRRDDAPVPARSRRRTIACIRTRSWRTAAATCPTSGATSSGACATATSSRSSRPTRSNWGSTSAISTRSSAPATPARVAALMAALRARRASRRAVDRRARHVQRARRSVPGARPALRVRRPRRRGAHRSRQRRDPDPAPEVRGVRDAVQDGRRVRLARRRGDARRARLPRRSRGAPRGARAVPLGRRRVPGEQRVLAEHRLGQRRHRRRHRLRDGRSAPRRRIKGARSPRSTGAARTRCCTSRPSTSTTARRTKWSGSISRTTRRTSAKSTPSTTRTR